ncbi:hypothetical protein [Candidatus Magnetomonas plexicatena]|uniref:hypothetical protein n=1 Tax=Candidatus Magnetomonas plexicatena TaxID=2552947 RepID=UPI001C789414|nr:hypothetical protein E2O03_007275 [Nitrospirales bacterium LBB_01]
MFKYNKICLSLLAVALFIVTLLLPLDKSYALPSFARQTGLNCYNCHTIWPELTPMGRAFKLTGYVQSTSDRPYEPFPPLSVGGVISYTGGDQAGGLTNGISPFDNADHKYTDKTNALQEFNAFYGGRIYGDFGAFLQGTFDGVAKKVILDMADIRYAKSDATLFGKPLVFGVTVNNRPSIQDVWNSTPVWGFPYASSSVASTPSAATVIDGGLDTQVGGAGVYALWDNLIYVEGTLYRTTENSITKPLGAGNPTDTIVRGVAPYWRVALEKQCGQEHSFMVGTYGIVSNLYPGGFAEGPTDRYTDIAFDAQYQYIAPRHVLTTAATWIHEKQNLDATYALGGSVNNVNYLNTFKARISYAYRSKIGTVGGTVGYFNTSGSSDYALVDDGTGTGTLVATGLYAGNASGTPNSSGVILEANYLPIKYVKLGVQYTIYDKFNGSRTNYDGNGTDASSNNTIYLYTRIMY